MPPLSDVPAGVINKKQHTCDF